ncbi:hypothetical protein PMIN04_003854 [Paraphaeosphaeria minitans]
MYATYVSPAGMWAAAEFATVRLSCTFLTFTRFVSWVRGKDSDCRKSPLYSSDSALPRSMKNVWGEVTRREVKIGSGMALWERQNSFGSSDLVLQESQGSLGPRIRPQRVDEGGISQSAD